MKLIKTMRPQTKINKNQNNSKGRGTKNFCFNFNGLSAIKRLSGAKRHYNAFAYQKLYPESGLQMGVVVVVIL